ncbi:hypothetical protein GCM10008018_06760 [Paenibacillus marchantiophytorum]|uniref:DUF2577 domain-containing protein n=1 Tax=Paenibacillus marchantiophytorum TaxID=1619310 RepID=A0ABQ2BRD9_9BACL|nr:DUF2577 domain-containing protein [Paenibacillus marchantiophytorum]GGI44369.1 hypothetical protein GCM10008018_06760 [Paenibacillus marchantiophytorum]
MNNVTKLVRALKSASVGAVEAGTPVHITFGEVISIHPLEITVDQRFSLDQDFLIVPEQLTPYQIMIEGQPIVIRRGLEVGDSLLLLRMQGGQKYVLLDKVVEA